MKYWASLLALFVAWVAIVVAFWCFIAHVVVWVVKEVSNS